MREALAQSRRSLTRARLIAIGVIATAVLVIRAMFDSDTWLEGLELLVLPGGVWMLWVAAGLAADQREDRTEMWRWQSGRKPWMLALEGHPGRGGTGICARSRRTRRHRALGQPAPDAGARHVVRGRSDFAGRDRTMETRCRASRKARVAGTIRGDGQRGRRADAQLLRRRSMVVGAHALGVRIDAVPGRLHAVGLRGRDGRLRHRALGRRTGRARGP